MASPDSNTIADLKNAISQNGDAVSECFQRHLAMLPTPSQTEIPQASQQYIGVSYVQALEQPTDTLRQSESTPAPEPPADAPEAHAEPEPESFSFPRDAPSRDLEQMFVEEAAVDMDRPEAS